MQVQQAQRVHAIEIVSTRVGGAWMRLRHSIAIGNSTVRRQSERTRVVDVDHRSPAGDGIQKHRLFLSLSLYLSPESVPFIFSGFDSHSLGGGSLLQVACRPLVYLLVFKHLKPLHSYIFISLTGQNNIRKIMEAHPTFSIERSKQLNNMGMSGALSSSLSVLPVPPEEMYPKLSESQLDFVEQELMTRPFTHSSYLNSNGAVGHIFSSSPGYSTDLHHSSVSLDEKHSTNAHFISPSSTNMAQFPLSYSSNPGPPTSATSNHYSKKTVLPGIQILCLAFWIFLQIALLIIIG
ncbi:PHR isoform X6 [Spatholobus suberectus]|nr:PHR isoform X6 [Spatholobus suberectus]